MTRKKRKPASFDAMVKLFIRNYDIPTRKDIDILLARLDRLENLIKTTAKSGKGRCGADSAFARKKKGQAAVTAVDTVYQVIKRSKQGVEFADIRAKTGYEEKKVRNIIYRLHHMGRITRKSRGLYVATQ